MPRSTGFFQKHRDRHNASQRNYAGDLGLALPVRELIIHLFGYTPTAVKNGDGARRTRSTQQQPTSMIANLSAIVNCTRARTLTGLAPKQQDEWHHR